MSIKNKCFVLKITPVAMQIKERMRNKQNMDLLLNCTEMSKEQQTNPQQKKPRHAPNTPIAKGEKKKHPNTIQQQQKEENKK